MNVVVNGLMTNYQKVGKGKALVFLHGWGDTSATFSRLTSGLQDKYVIYMLDLPGFGGTQAPSGAWGLQDYANFVNTWLAKLNIKPYGLVGHSYGGAVAIMNAGGKTDIQKLILLASAGIRRKRILRKQLLRGVAKVGKVPLYILPATKQRRLKQKFYNSVGSDLMLLPHMEETYRRIIDEDVREPAARINIPTLLIYGNQDKDTPVSDGRILNSTIPNSRLEVIGAGHFLHQEEPTKIARIIKEFLEANESNV